MEDGAGVDVALEGAVFLVGGEEAAGFGVGGGALDGGVPAVLEVAL